MMTGALDFDTVFAQAPSLAGKTLSVLGGHFDALTLICLFLFMVRWQVGPSSCSTPGCPTPWKARPRSPP